MRKYGKELPGNKRCGDCWHFENGLVCSSPKSKLVRKDTDYCQWHENFFTETKLESHFIPEAWKNGTKAPVAGEQKFAGSPDEILLHEILERANYQCECDGSLCKTHEGRCSTLHKRRGGKHPLLLQPKNFNKGHSVENSQVMCAPCANGCTITRMNLKKKKKIQQNREQESII